MLKIIFFLTVMLMTCRISYADEPCPHSDPDEAIEACTYEIQSGKLNDYRLAIAYTNRAEAWNEKGEFDKAINDSNKAFSLNPKYINALCARGMAWQGIGEYDKAIGDYSAVIEQLPKDSFSWWVSSVYMRRGAAWGLKGNLNNSIADSTEAIRLDPTKARAFYNRGFAWKLKGDYDKAIADYREAILLNPADPRGLNKFPAKWDKMGKTEQSDVLFKGLTFSGITSTSPEVERVYDVQKTRFGNVLIVGKRKGSGGPDTIMLNGRSVFQAKAMYLGFLAKHSIDDKDILLFGVNCGGSACSPDMLNFLIIRADGATDVITSKELYSADGRIAPRKEKDRIVIDLGFEKGMKKTATLKSGRVDVQYTETYGFPMELEDCTWLYESSSEECMRFRERKLDCEQFGRDYSGGSLAEMTRITALSNHPGFVSRTLGDICVTECKTGIVVPFEHFKKNVCSIK